MSMPPITVLKAITRDHPGVIIDADDHIITGDVASTMAQSVSDLPVLVEYTVGDKHITIYRTASPDVIEIEGHYYTTLISSTFRGEAKPDPTPYLHYTNSVDVAASYETFYTTHSNRWSMIAAVYPHAICVSDRGPITNISRYDTGAPVSSDNPVAFNIIDGDNRAARVSELLTTNPDDVLYVLDDEGYHKVTTTTPLYHNTVVYFTTEELVGSRW